MFLQHGNIAVCKNVCWYLGFLSALLKVYTLSKIRDQHVLQHGNISVC